MIWEQYSSIITVATALFLTKWVLQSDDTSYPNVFLKNDLSKKIETCLVKYSNLQKFKSSSGYNHFYELQNLLSWQDAYRRGDLRFHSELDFSILPVNVIIKEDKKGEDSLQTISNLFFDDGYDSSGLSLDSPASSILSGTRNPDCLSLSLSPSLSDYNRENVSYNDLPGAVGFSTDFDIDAFLENYDSNLEVEKSSKIKIPFSKLEDVDQDLDYINLDYINSPLKSPTFDEFLVSPNPGFPTKYGLDISLEDPFKMHFTNSSYAHGKLLSDVSLNMDDYEINGIKIEEDIDRALVESLSLKSSRHVAKELNNDEETKELFSLTENITHEVDHDYYQRSDSYLDYNSKNKPINLLTESGHVTELSCTFAPPNPARVKKHEKDSEYVWPDFPYTSEELVMMPVDTFNDVIKVLTEIRKHVAKDIRRKGKNKFAARGCRKRKNDLIKYLDNGVDELLRKKEKLLDERRRIIAETLEIRRKTLWLNNYIFMHLRDSNGSLYSSVDYSLQYTSDGNVYIVPSGKKSKAII